VQYQVKTWGYFALHGWQTQTILAWHRTDSRCRVLIQGFNPPVAVSGCLIADRDSQTISEGEAFVRDLSCTFHWRFEALLDVLGTEKEAFAAPWEQSLVKSILPLEQQVQQPLRLHFGGRNGGLT
jgi:hypothetical protein